MERETPAAPGRGEATIGFVLSHEQFRVDELVELAVAAERAGFDAVSTSDHFQPWQDNEGHAGQAWVTLSAVGARTERIAMGTLVTCPSFRYRPAIVAEGFASLGILYPGRVYLGVGTGEALNEVPAGGGWGEFLERARRMVESIDIIRALWTGETVNHEGTYYTVNDARLYDVPERPIPIYVAGSAEESNKTAGKHGDGLVTDAERAVKPELRKAFEEGAREAGKDPSALAVVAEHWVIVGDKEDARRYCPLWQFLPKAWDLYVDDPSPVSIRERAHGDVPLDQVYGSWPVSRDPQVHAERLQELIDGGVTHIFVHSPQPDQRAIVDFYGSEVLPRVKKVMAAAR